MRLLGRRLDLVTAVVVLMIVSSCGTTLHVANKDANGLGGAGTSGIDQVGGAGTSGIDQGATPVGTVSPSLGASSAARPAGATQRVGAALAGPSVPTTRALAVGGGRPGWIPAGKNTHGITDSTIEVGLVTVNAASANASLGAITGHSLGALPDYQKGAQAVVDYINAHGGVAGRQIVPVYYQADLSRDVTASGRQQEVQAACARWTEDHHVFAMMLSPDVLDCALATKTVVLAYCCSGIPMMSDSMFPLYRDLWYGPAQMLTERREGDLVDALWRQGYFKPGSKVGVLIEDSPASKEGVANGTIPALARHGIKPVLQIVYPDPVESPWDTYMVQLFGAGVDRVIMSTSLIGPFAALFAMTAANNQHYYPQWALGSEQLPSGLAALGAPQAELAHTQGMGWVPNTDVGDTTDQSSTAALCHKVQRDMGVGPGAELYCDPLFSLRLALQNAAEVSPAGMNAGLAAVGDHYPSVYTIGGTTSLSPDRHDGVSVERDFGYDSQCANDNTHCFMYTSPPQPMP